MTRSSLIWSARAWLASMLVLGCTAEAVEDKAREVGNEAKDKAKQAGEDLADKAKDKAESWWADDVPDSGELSESAAAMLRKGADSGGVEAAVTRGVQLAPVALDVAKTLHSAIDSETLVEPIVQKVDDEDAQSALDAKISDMPRVETMEGVSVGFKDMTQYDTGGRTTESAYLVLWRRDDRLLGFVYRSRKRVDIETLIRETPRLIGIVQGAL
jgi:hypothetical protein